MNINRQDAVYLLKWNFENSLSEVDNAHEIIWVLPSITTQEVIKKQWYDKWEYVNDPFYGFSFAHDINIFNLPKGHIILHDNGRNHRASMTPDVSCPMSRAVEYKIEMDVNGNKGFNRITLMFSYPKVSDYPEFIYLEENVPELNKEKCGEFWKIYNYQPIFGSARKTLGGDYVMSYYPINIHAGIQEKSTVRMLKLNGDGEIVNAWSPKNIIDTSVRIIPINSKKFRDGIYYDYGKEF